MHSGEINKFIYSSEMNINLRMYELLFDYIEYTK